ncbi:hypothetical protein KAI46_04405 [bacterium]|nr:hypothetical protein [bacterium]
MKKISLLLICGLVFFFCFSSFVLAWDMPKIGKKKSVAGVAGVSIDDALKGQGDLVETYMNGVQSNLKANALLIDALGDKESADKYNAAAEGISSGNCDSDCLDKNIELTEESNAKCDELLGSAEEVSAESKVKFGESLKHLGTAVLYYKQASAKSADSLSKAKSVIESAPITKKLSFRSKLKPVLKIAPRAPKDFFNAGKTLKKCIDFAKINKIEVPKDATEALGEL